MINKFEVHAWVVDGKGLAKQGKYHKVYSGRSLIKSIYQAWKAKSYSGCVKIEWRGTR